MHVPVRLVYPETQTFVEACQQLLSTTQVNHVSLNFAQTLVVDSSGVGALRCLTQVAKSQGIQLECAQVKPQLRSQLVSSIPDLNFLVESAPEATSVIPAADQFMPHPSVRSPWKRAMDIAGGTIGLAITSILFVPIAIAIRLESPGPILFVQTRIGYMGRTFRMWKFRSMVVNAEALKTNVTNQINSDGKFFKNAEDPRVTKVGRWLRKTSLDEFPQFWNILRGEMSLVGTRPPTSDEVVNYNLYEWQRLNVKPGATGEWQTKGRSAIQSFSEVVELDLQYQERWTILYDLKIIGRTVRMLLSKRGDAC